VPRDTGGVRRALNEFSETLPEVRVRIKNPRLRVTVEQWLTRAGVPVVAPATRGEGRHAGAVVVCEASYLTRGAARGRSGSCVAVVPEAESDEARRALAAGAAAIVFAENLAALPATVVAVAGGQLVIPSALRTAITKPVLTTREKQILALVVMGFSNREIADQLFIAESTVKSHLFSAFRRLGVRSRKEATALILDSEDGLGRGILAITQ
jgi:DNA-binding NarL/FixJ family response regulator